MKKIHTSADKKNTPGSFQEVKISCNANKNQKLKTQTYNTKATENTDIEQQIKISAK